MLTLLPRQVPPLALMLADIGNPSAAQLGRAFGVTPRTAASWCRLDRAPLPVLLALFWLTRWGRSQVDCQAVNAARLQAGLADALAAENRALRAQLARLVNLGHFGCANDPILSERADDERQRYKQGRQTDFQLPLQSLPTSRRSTVTRAMMTAASTVANVLMMTRRTSGRAFTLPAHPAPSAWRHAMPP